MSDYIFGNGKKLAAIVIAWPLGLALIIASLGTMFMGQLILSFFMLIGGGIILPAIREIIHEHFGRRISLPYALIIALVLVVAAPSDKVRPPVMATTSSSPATQRTPPPALTPEQIAQHEKDRQVALAQKAKVEKAARAEALMKDVEVYEELLAGAEIDLKRGHLVDIDMRGVGAMLEVIYGTAHSIQAAWWSRDILSPADIDHLKAAEAKLSSFQQRAFPKLRLAYKKQAGEVLWEHDVTVKIGGSNNTVLSFFGYIFAANANIKAAEEQVDDLTTRLRFKRLQFSADEYLRGSAYNFATPSDSVIAGYDGGFQKLNRGH